MVAVPICVPAALRKKRLTPAASPTLGVPPSLSDRSKKLKVAVVPGALMSATVKPAPSRSTRWVRVPFAPLPPVPPRKA